MRKTLAVVCVLCFACAGGRAEIRLPHIFSDSMVLQRGKPVRVWGWAGKGQTVAVGFGGQSKGATAGADGKWIVTLDAMEANATGQTLTIKAGGETVSLGDVLIGDVWLCGGQSNMQMSLRSSRDADVEIPCAKYPGIRFIRVTPQSRAEPQEDFPVNEPGRTGVWLPCEPETIGECSGVAYFFGLRLHRRLGVPIGLISASWGGTMAQHWVTRGRLETIPEVKPYIDTFDQKFRQWKDGGGEAGAKKRYEADVKKWESESKAAKAAGEQVPRRPDSRGYANPGHGRLPGGPLNAMIMPMAGLSIRGALFYQGENNSFGDTWIPFRKTFPAVIAEWRKLFRDEKLPFGIIQIAGWSTRRTMEYDMNHHTNVVREVQFNTWRNTPNTGLIVSFDANSNQSIHPGRKYPVGERSARWALSTVYGIGDAVRRGPLQWHGPVYKSMEKQGARILVHFAQAGAGGLRLDKDDDRGFHIAGADRVFHHARARVVASRGRPAAVVVWSEDVADPVAVRYAWANLPLGTLMNGKELPASPFRTDTWPIKPHRGEAVYRVAPAKAGK